MQVQANPSVIVSAQDVYNRDEIHQSAWAYCRYNRFDSLPVGSSNSSVVLNEFMRMAILSVHSVTYASADFFARDEIAQPMVAIDY